MSGRRQRSVRPGQRTTDTAQFRVARLWPAGRHLARIQDAGRVELPATILLNSLVCENYPDVIERIKRRGDEICAHGRTNSEALAGLWEHDEERIISETTEMITRHFGARPLGWRDLPRPKAE